MNDFRTGVSLGWFYHHELQSKARIGIKARILRSAIAPLAWFYAQFLPHFRDVGGNMQDPAVFNTYKMNNTGTTHALLARYQPDFALSSNRHYLQMTPAGRELFYLP